MLHEQGTHDYFTKEDLEKIENKVKKMIEIDNEILEEELPF